MRSRGSVGPITSLSVCLGSSDITFLQSGVYILHTLGVAQRKGKFYQSAQRSVTVTDLFPLGDFRRFYGQFTTFFQQDQRLSADLRQMDQRFVSRIGVHRFDI